MIINNLYLQTFTYFINTFNGENTPPLIKFVVFENEKIELTKNEKNLLYLLIKNIGTTISYLQIEDFVYDGETKSSDAIRSLIKRLRKKLPEDLILNSLDEGYYIKK